MNANTAKPLDHLVLPVSSLDVARGRLSALGFTVAPDGFHPFGTGNACVFFKDDTYLEPLAVIDAAIAASEAEKGNRFVHRDRFYRERNGDDGFSLIALGSRDAAGDLAQCREKGFDCGEMVSFQRDVVQSDGTNGMLSINLFIASIDASPDLAMFNCQWLSGREFDDRQKRHANSALGVCSIAIVGADSPVLVDYLIKLTWQNRRQKNRLQLQNATIQLMNGDDFYAAYGVDVDNNGMKAHAFDVEVEAIQSVKYVLFASGIKSRMIGNRLVVEPADGQGYTLGFVEKEDAVK